MSGFRKSQSYRRKERIMLEAVKKSGNYIVAVSAMIPAWLSDGLVTLLSNFLILMSPMAVHGLDGPGRWKNYSWLGIVIVLVMVLLLARYMNEDNTPKKIRWSIVIPALLFVGSMFVSECIVPKVRPVYQGVSKCYLAYILLGAILGRYDRVQEKFWDNFMRGVGVSFVLSAVFCFMHRPVYEGYGYLGIYTNPNPFGIYLVLVIAAAIWSLHQILYGEKKKGLMPYWMAVVILALFFIVKSGSRASLLNAILLLAVWPLLVALEKGTWKARWAKMGRIVTVYGTLLVFMVLSYSFLNDMLDTIPLKVNHPITTELDPEDYQAQMDSLGDRVETRESQFNEDTVLMIKMSAGGESPEEEDVSAIARLLETFQKDGLEAVLGMRGRIYQYGIDNMNWYGHENGTYFDEYYWYDCSHMHNSAIQYGYVYGYACIVGYLILLIVQCVVLLKQTTSISSQSFVWMLILFVYALSYLLEAGGTVVRDVTLVPYLLATGQMIWKAASLDRYPNKASTKE